MDSSDEIVALIDRISDLFDEAWSDGKRPSIPDFLEQAPPTVLEDSEHRRSLLRELVSVDIEYRRRNGETITPGEYQAYVEGDPQMESFVKSCFQGISASDDATAVRQSTGTGRPGGESQRKQIGPYKLLQQIGEGGMGSVWMAEQHRPVRRMVAIKVIRGNLGTKETIARFEAERQALAMMDHTNIARVLDAGATDDGSPYFVMELVRGVPITEYCDTNKLSVRERLQLMIPVCHAVQHAHQKGIIHRDLKPSNVLVTLYDGKPVPKVIDFGLAKAVGHTQKLTDKTMFTEFGKVVGTVQYMSPEQAEMNALDVDTRTDIYALGVMLYEMLTGSTPVDQKTMADHALLGILEMIREKEPPRPSSRLSTTKEEKVAGISKQRRIAPAKLQQILRGELDWVVMKALDKDRTRRYESASGLIDDLQRFLNNEPVLARPPTTGYRIRKFVRKHRAAVGSAALVAVSLIAGIIGTTVFMLRAWQAEKDLQNQFAIVESKSKALAEANSKAVEQRQKAVLAAGEAEQQRATAQAVVDFLQHDLLRQANPWQFQQRAATNGSGPAPLTLRTLVDTAAEKFKPETIADRFPGKPLVQVKILTTIGDLYEGLSESEQAVRFHEAAFGVMSQNFGKHDPETMKALTSVACVNLFAENHGRAVDLFIEIYDRLKFLVDQEFPIKDTKPGSVPVAPDDQNENSPAIAAIDAVLERAEERIDPGQHTFPVIDAEIMDATRIAKVLFRVKGIIQFAEQMRQRFGREDRRVMFSELALGCIYSGMLRWKDAKVVFERCLENMERQIAAGRISEDHITVIGLYMVLAVTYDQLEIEPQRKLELMDKSVAIMVRNYGTGNPGTLIAMRNLAATYEQEKQVSSAIDIRKRILAACRKFRRPESADSLKAILDLARLYQEQGQRELALPLTEETLELVDSSSIELGDKIFIIEELAEAYEAVEDKETYLQLGEKLIELYLKDPDRLDTNYVFNIVSRLVRYRIQDQQSDQAIELCKRVLAASELEFGRDEDFTQAYVVRLGSSHLAAGNLETATRMLEEVYSKNVHPNLKSLAVPDLRACYLQSKQFDKLDKTHDYRLSLIREKLKSNKEAYVAEMLGFGLQLKSAGQWDRAEEVLHELKDERVKNEPDQWLTFEIMSTWGEISFRRKLDEIGFDVESDWRGKLEQKDFTKEWEALDQGFKGLKQRQGRIAEPNRMALIRRSAQRALELAKIVEDEERQDHWQSELDQLPPASTPDGGTAENSDE